MESEVTSYLAALLAAVTNATGSASGLGYRQALQATGTGAAPVTAAERR